jgi:hypothetical protein
MKGAAVIAAVGLWASGARADMQISADVYGAGFVQGLRERSVFNPDNAYLDLPTSGALLDLRPRFAYEAANVTVRIEPRARLRYDDAQDADSEIFLTQAYLDLGLGPRLRVRGGVQNYQWGPAELLAPSNPFFQAKTGEQGYLFEQRGKSLARVDLSLDGGLTLAGLGEFVGNGEDEPIAGRAFEPRFLVRADYLMPGTLSSFGATVGRGLGAKAFSGEYFNYYVSEAVSLYADLLQSYGDPTLRPVLKNSGLEFRADPTRGTQHVATGGLRFEGRVDVRMEYVYNGWGLSKDEFNAVGDYFAALPPVSALPPSAIAAGRTLGASMMASGRDLQGRHYAYASLRVSDWPRDASSLTSRFLLSLEEASMIAQVAYDQGVGERWTLFLEPTLFLGGRGSRQSALLRYVVAGGLKAAF